jgi:HlyD family secretion protein
MKNKPGGTRTMKKISSPLVVFIGLILALQAFHCSKAGDGEIKAPGIVDGDIITLKAVVSGAIRELDMKEGEMVPRDKVLVQIDGDKIKNQLKELDIRAKEVQLNRQKINNKLRFLYANIDYLKKQALRFKRLKNKKALPGEKLETMELKLLEAQTSRFELKKTLAELDLQEEKINNKQEYLQLVLKDHRIVSPVDGLVLETFVSLGETVFPGAAVADILDRSGLFIEVFVEEKELAALTLNQTVDIRVDGHDNQQKPVTGVISYFGKKAEFSPKYIISETERKALLYQVKIRVSDADGVLKIGMPVTVILAKQGAKKAG